MSKPTDFCIKIAQAYNQGSLILIFQYLAELLQSIINNVIATSRSSGANNYQAESRVYRHALAFIVYPETPSRPLLPEPELRFEHAFVRADFPHSDFCQHHVLPEWHQ